MEQIDIDLLNYLNDRDKEESEIPEPDPDRFYEREREERIENINEKD